MQSALSETCNLFPITTNHQSISIPIHPRLSRPAQILAVEYACKISENAASSFVSHLASQVALTRILHAQSEGKLATLAPIDVQYFVRKGLASTMTPEQYLGMTALPARHEASYLRTFGRSASSPLR